MDFQSAMETFAEAWVAANAGQQNQALALTRAVAAANAAAKSPAAHLAADIAVKKEHSLSPPSHQQHLHHQQQQHHHHLAQQHQQQQQHHQQGSSSSSVAGGSATGGDETPNSHRRRSSLQGVQEKLTQLQMQQQQHQLQQQQQQQQQQAQDDAAHSPQSVSGGGRYSASSATRRSTDDCSPMATGGDGAAVNATDRHSVPPSNALNGSAGGGPGSASSACGPKPMLTDEGPQHPRSAVGSITCLPPAALNAVAAAAAAANSQQQSQLSHGGVGGASSASLPLPMSMPSPAGNMEHRRDFDVSKVNSKSLPLHCVVESVHSLQASLTLDTRSPWKRRPSVETDSYVIVAASTPWSEIVQTALQRLGYSQETASSARGALILKNWKPIPLEQISDNPMVPVSDIIGELASVITLRIVILRAKHSPFGEIKDKLLRLLVLHSHAVLRSTGCPLDESTLAQICRSTYQDNFSFPGGEISEDVRRKFDQWWSNQVSPQARMAPKMLPFMTGPSAVPGDLDFPTAAVAAAAAAAAAAHAGLHASGGGAGAVPPGMSVPSGISASRESLLMNDSGAGVGGPGSGGVGPMSGAGPHHHAGMMVHPAMHASMHHHSGHGHGHSQYTGNQKTRMRTSFDPEMELPKLQKWFQENPHPSRQQIQTYVVQLNALDSRRGRKPLDVNNVVYWFKNARAAQKRAEMRGGLGALGHAAMNGYLSQHGGLGQNSGSSAGSISSGQHLGGGGGDGRGSNIGSLSLSHDYLKSPLSLKSDDIEMSQHSDDMDEDTSRPGSPQLPLSLTTHERNRATPQGGDDEDDDEEDGRPRGEEGGSGAGGEAGGARRDDADGPAAELLKSSLNQMVERSRSRSYNNEEEQSGCPKTEESNGELNENDNSNGHQVAKGQDGETNNNNNNSGGGGNKTSGSNHNNSGASVGGSSANELQQAQQQQLMDVSPKLQSPKEEEEDLDIDEDDEDNENDTSNLEDYRSPSPDLSNAMVPRKDLAFPMVPNSMFSQSFMYMSQYMPGFSHAAAGHPHAHHAAAAAAAAGMQQNPLMGAGGLNLTGLTNEERRKRNRTFIDPVTEVPKLEQWFALNTHPSHNLILKYTEDLNTMPYRQKFPRLESKNVQFWFKNRRAKNKRLKMSLYDNSQCSQLSGLNSFVHKYEERD